MKKTTTTKAVAKSKTSKPTTKKYQDGGEKRKKTKSSGTGERTVDGKDYPVSYKEKVTTRKGGETRKVVTKEKGMGEGNPIRKSKDVKKYQKYQDGGKKNKSTKKKE